VAQATAVAERLATTGWETHLVLLETQGDLSSAPLETLGGQGVFALEIQRAVLDGRADVAVHSAKDLPSVTSPGLQLASVPERRDPADVLVGRSLAGLGAGATVATGSPRRRALLLERRPDLHVIGLRGNMATRLAAAERPDVDAVVAAAAALERLGWSDRIAERLDPSWFVPQVGQGALALECRLDDDTVAGALREISDPAAEREVLTERAFLAELGAGCQVPAGAFATSDGDCITLHAVMASRDGSRVIREDREGRDPESLGREVARTLRDERGGGDLVS
jgi:hydroxymethylbilane synthase